MTLSKMGGKAAQAIAAIRELLPQITARAADAERHRRIPDETAAELAEAGLFKLYRPRRFGGFELPYGSLQLTLSALLGSACASTAWVQSGIATHGWLLGYFPDEAMVAGVG